MWRVFCVHNTKNENACSEENIKYVEDWPFDKEISVGGTTERISHQEEHGQFELKEMEMGWRKGDCLTSRILKDETIQLFSCGHALFFKAKGEWLQRWFKDYQGHILGLKRCETSPRASGTGPPRALQSCRGQNCHSSGSGSHST